MAPPAAAQSLDKTGALWGPYLEWSLENSGWSGNSLHLEAWAAFTYQGSGETRRTGMFYDGGNTWKFRFTATRTGTWTFSTQSSYPALSGRTGTVAIGEATNQGSSGKFSWPLRTLWVIGA